MEDQTPMPDPNAPPAATPAANGHDHHAGGRRVKRRLMVAIVGLYAASVVAACVLLLRGQAAPPLEAKEGGAGRRLLALSQTAETVGWVTIHGPIYSSESGKPWERGQEQWLRKLKQMAETKGVKAIVLDINSPGGSVGAVQEMHSQILRLRRDKKIPIVALFGDVAASGGYYIAAACDKIVAHPGTLTGSIGVIFSVSNLEGLFSKIGYKTDPIKSGKHKDIGSPARPMTPEERALLQAVINDAYGQFLAAVATGRNLPVEKVKPHADGRIFSGSQALSAGLVDQLGDSQDAIELAAKLGGIKGKPKVRRDAEKFADIFEILESSFAGRLAAGAPKLIDSLRPEALLEYRWAGF
jgi:protease-4